MKRYTFHAPAVMVFEVEADNEQDARQQAVTVRATLEQIDEPAAFRDDTLTAAHDPRFWVLKRGRIHLVDAAEVENIT